MNGRKLSTLCAIAIWLWNASLLAACTGAEPAPYVGESYATPLWRYLQTSPSVVAEPYLHPADVYQEDDGSWSVNVPRPEARLERPVEPVAYVELPDPIPFECVNAPSRWFNQLCRWQREDRYDHDELEVIGCGLEIAWPSGSALASCWVHHFWDFDLGWTDYKRWVFQPETALWEESCESVRD